MKNTVLSLVIAVFLVMTAAHASVTSDTDLIGFYAYGEGLQTAQSLVLENTDLTENVTVKFRGELTFRSDSSKKINLTATEVKILANKTASVTIRAQSGLGEADSGLYSGTFEVLDKDTNATLFVIPAYVAVPGLKLTLSTTPSSKVERAQTLNVSLTYKNLGKFSDLDEVTLVQLSVYDKSGDLLYDYNDDALEVTDEELEGIRHGGGSEKFIEIFTLPYDLDTSKITVKAVVIACNEDYGSECFEIEVSKNLSVDNKDDKIDITKASFLPSNLQCGTNKAKLDVEVTNFGDRRQDLVLTLRNEQTGTDIILNNAEEVELDNDYSEVDTYTASHVETLTLNGLKTGSNLFTLYVDYGVKTPASKELTLNLASCAPVANTTTSSTTSGSGNIIVNTQTGSSLPTLPPATNTLPTVNPSYVTLKDVSGFSLDSDWILPTAVGIGGLIVGILVVLLVVPRH